MRLFKETGVKILLLAFAGALLLFGLPWTSSAALQAGDPTATPGASTGIYITVT